MKGFIMKVYIISTVLLLFSAAMQAQFVLTPSGLVSAADNSMPYVEYEFKGLMQNFLYDHILPNVKESINQQDNVIELEPKQILIEGKGINKIGLGPIKGNILYRLSIGMVDNKVGYEVQELGFSNVYLIEPTEIPPQMDSVPDFIFDKNGELHSQGLKEQVEEYFNAIVNSLNAYIEDVSDRGWDL